MKAGSILATLVAACAIAAGTITSTASAGGSTNYNALTVPQLERQTTAWINKRAKFVGNPVRVVSTRCQASDATFFFCIVREHDGAYNFNVYYNVTYNPSTGVINWHPTS